MSHKYNDHSIGLVQAAIATFYADSSNATLIGDYSPPILPILPYPWGTSTGPTPQPDPKPLPRVTVNKVLGFLSKVGLHDEALITYLAHDPQFLIQMISKIVRDERSDLTTNNPEDLIFP